jgi:hypothetical protein
MACVDGEKAELPVFLDRLRGEAARPAVVAREPRRERKGRMGRVEIEA